MAEPSASNAEDATSVRDDHVVVGRIRGSWGLRGDVRVEVLTDFPERFSSGSVLFVGDRPVRVERSRDIGRGLLVKLDIASARADAERLVGRFLSVPESDLEQLPEGSYYQFQLIGMEVWSDEGEQLGTVEDIFPTGGNDVYVVAREGSPELLLPAIKDVILDVDITRNRMTVKLIEGLR